MTNLTYSFRPATLEDAKLVTELIIASDIAEYGVPDCTIEDVLDIWSNIPIETNTWIIKKDETLVGYGFLEEMSKGRLDCYGFIHPSWYGNGAGTLLISQMEQRAKEYIVDYEKDQIPYELNNYIPATNPSAISLLEGNKYTFDKVYSRMVIDMKAEPEVTPLAEDVVLLPYNSERDSKGLYNAYVESFQDTRSYYEEPFEDWIRKRNTEQHDQSLWYVTYFNEELVGFIICKNFPEGTYVEYLGVKRTGRKKGIGSALLTTVFKESYNRGIKTVLLNVDANSLTGANRLYESVGMNATFQIACYRKTSF
ncbi:GNAT family N-acetyltransferase [Fredinandcohnia sp. 179-A 10B2 NHS]|uniref:GNAT family N-acetyltransferase n=1 Tax=Fredinandcohnia sp. 179-A 10B2 NHS TaxID=3235176 RepID=UPI0039A299DA